MLQRFRLDDPAFLDQLASRLEAALRHAGTPRRGLLSVTLAAPEIPFDDMPHPLPDMAYWCRPSSSFKLLGLGAAAVIEASGVERWCRVKDAFAAWQSAWQHEDADATGLRPLALGGFAFAAESEAANLPATRLVVPEMLLRRVGDVTALTFTFANGQPQTSAMLHLMRQLATAMAVQQNHTTTVDLPLQRESCQPSEQEWMARVGDAAADIQAGLLDKVVLSRRLTLAAPQPFVVSRIMATLSKSHPRCSVFALATPDGGVFMGASPELLARLRNGEASCDALAGTAWDDGHGLLSDVKNAREHRLVVQSIAESLRPLCARLEVPAAPVVLHLGHLHHLWSSLHGKTKPGVGLLDLLERLHPTPAVGGYPRQTALDWLASHGESRHDWYTGAVGWMDAAGDGEFAVALRCAHIRGNRADLYAGAGIVAGSDARTELAETEAKLAAMLDAIGGKGA